jgi:hypothetical protein
MNNRRSSDVKTANLSGTKLLGAMDQELGSSCLMVYGYLNGNEHTSDIIKSAKIRQAEKCTANVGTFLISMSRSRDYYANVRKRDIQEGRKRAKLELNTVGLFATFAFLHEFSHLLDLNRNFSSIDDFNKCQSAAKWQLEHEDRESEEFADNSAATIMSSLELIKRRDMIRKGFRVVNLATGEYI